MKHDKKEKIRQKITKEKRQAKVNYYLLGGR